MRKSSERAAIDRCFFSAPIGRLRKNCYENTRRPPPLSINVPFYFWKFDLSWSGMLSSQISHYSLNRCLGTAARVVANELVASFAFGTESKLAPAAPALPVAMSGIKVPLAVPLWSLNRVIEGGPVSQIKPSSFEYFVVQLLNIAANYFGFDLCYWASSILFLNLFFI